jgi:Tfp pilus assembly protein PilF
VKDKAQQEIQEEKLLTLFTNMAICSSKMNKFGQVITYCKKAKNYDHSNVKILFLLGKASLLCLTKESQ